MATVNFLYRSTRQKAPLILRLLFRHNTNDIVISTKSGYNIEKTYWQNVHNKKKLSDALDKVKREKTRKDLLKIETFVLEQFNKTTPDLITKEWLKETLDKFYNPTKEDPNKQNLIYWIEHLISTANMRKNAKGGIGLSYNRIKGYKDIEKTIIQFQEYKKQGVIKIVEMDKMKFNEISEWLFNVRDYAPSTVMKKLTDLKVALKVARENGVEITKDYENLKFTRVKTHDDDTDVITLTIEDIEKIEGVDLKSNTLINARKWLILGCFTGQRGSALTTRVIKENFKENEIIIKQKKGNKSVVIPILPRTREIYNNGLPYKISTQKLNEHIKEVCKLAELNEMILGKKTDVIEDKKGNRVKRGVKKERPKYKYISTHTGRRTFATIHFDLGMPLQFIKSVTGHKKDETLLLYINRQSNAHINAYDELYKKLEQKAKREFKPKVISNKKAI